jgi:hypothetical protein
LVGFSQLSVGGGASQSALWLPGARGEAIDALFPTVDASLRTPNANMLAQSSLNLSLIHVEALRTLGLQAEQRGDHERAFRLMRLAGRWGWRDVPTQLWLLREAALAENFSVAVQRADALVRLGVLKSELFSTFRYAAGSPTALPALVQSFVEKPGWRSDFFAEAGNTPPALFDNMDSLIIALRPTVAPVTRDELRAYLRVLVSKGEGARAWRLWHAQFDDRNGVASIRFPLSWPGIEAQTSPSPFDWTPIDQGFDLRYEDENKIARLVVTNEFGASGPVVERWIALQAGKYRLQPGVTEGSDSRLWHWSIGCADQRVLLDADGQGGTVVIPPGCETQRIVLILHDVDDIPAGETRITAPRLDRLS